MLHSESYVRVLVDPEDFVGFGSKMVPFRNVHR
jgi:hypothetical protein